MNLMPELLVQRGETLRQAMEKLDRSGRGILLVLTPDNRLEYTVTDGDIRRAILAGVRLDDSIETLLAHKDELHRRAPTTAPASLGREQWISIMRSAKVAQLPLLDDDGRVCDLVTLSQLTPEPDAPVRAVIMAGGQGIRLRPLTEHTPKPMLPVGGKPLIEHTISRLREAGIRRINITTHYLSQKITNYFGSGDNFGVELNYVFEEQPLGTAGALRLLEESDEPLLVINGDIFTRVDFGAMLNFHRKQGADATVGVRHFELEVPYGVIETKDGRVRRLREKPKYEFLTNAGIYLVEPTVLRHIPTNKRCDMTDLIATLLEQDRVVTSFPVVEYWLDIGRHPDFAQVQQDIQKMRWAA